MEALKRYLLDNFEGVFVLVILIFVSAIVWFVDAKLAFLNFFYLPVLLGSYYLGIRSGVLGAFFTFLVVAIFASIYPDTFVVAQNSFSIWASILTWAGFLILTAVIVGFTHRELQEKMTDALRARAEASGNAELLEQTMTTIREFESELDFKVQERTRVLEEKTKSIKAHKEKVEEALYSTMDPAVVKLMIENRIRTENRRISVLFADLKGFTQYSEEHSAEVVITELNKYLADMETVLLQYNAHIDKYMGDGIMAEFGAPIRFEKHPLLSVTCAWKMQERMLKSNFPFKLRVGIATGVATTGIIGAKRQSFTAFGDTVNLASRIEGMCEPGKITVDEATFKECGHLIDFRPVSGLSSFAHFDNPGLVDEINQLLVAIQTHPEDIALRMQIGSLLIKANDPEQAQTHFKTALELEPANRDAKLAYAETIVSLEKTRDMNVRGRRSTVHLYEMIGFKNPVNECKSLPRSLLADLEVRLNKFVAYPEDLVLPVECIDGSVGFSKLIGITAFLIADRMNLADQEKHDILEAGYLAEIGKTIVPENILNRNGGLTEEDFTHIHMHPRESVRKLRNTGYENETMLELIECHHENYDGTGYPTGLRSDDIPMGARILAVAEAYISLTTKRPYRDPWEAHAAFNEINKYVRNGKFDPTIVKVLGELIVDL
ncbi:MAG: HD domain-containing phosphohydrolase [Pseudohongiellaceae bacterium]